MWLGMWDVPRGTGSVSRCSMIVLKIPRRLPWPNRTGSTRNVHNNSIQPFACREDTFADTSGKAASRWCSDSGWCQQTPTAAAVTWVIMPWHLHGRAWSMAGQIGHRDRGRRRIVVPDIMQRVLLKCDIGLLLLHDKSRWLLRRSAKQENRRRGGRASQATTHAPHSIHCAHHTTGPLPPPVAITITYVSLSNYITPLCFAVLCTISQCLSTVRLNTRLPGTLTRWRALQVDRRWERKVKQKLEIARRHKVTPQVSQVTFQFPVKSLGHSCWPFLFLSCAWLGLAWLAAALPGGLPAVPGA